MQKQLQENRNTVMRILIEKAKKQLPKAFIAQPWTHPGLAHGTAILKNEEQLNAYTAAYGEMHQIKCNAAFQKFPFAEMNGSVHIVDWGCGQGFGAYCAIRKFEEYGLENLIRKVELIEPSSVALQKAVTNISELTKGGVNILTHNCFCPGDGTKNEIELLSYSHDIVIHIFSNILDIEAVNLQKLAKICATSCSKVYILCMSPTNSHAYRIDIFHSIFGKPECFSNIEDWQYDRTCDTGHFVSCKTKCFRYDGSALQTEDKMIKISADFFGNIPVRDDYELESSGILYRQQPLLRDLHERIAQEINPFEDFLMLEPNIEGDIVDIMVLRPARGILIVKMFNEDIKSFKFYEKKENNKTTTNKNKLVNVETGEIIISPIVSIGGYQKKLLTGIDEKLLKTSLCNAHYLSLVQKMIIFTKNSTAEVRAFFKNNFDYCLPFGNDFKEDEFFKGTLLNKVWLKQFPDFTGDIISTFCRIVCPDWHIRKEGRLIKLSPEQASLARSEMGKSQKISGVAGSGKTLVLATRCINAQKRSGGDVLVLTFNKTLANYMRHRINQVYEDFPWSKIHISHYHRFFRQHAHHCLKHTSLSSYDDINFFDNESAKFNFRRYDAIFVDEVQDYKTEWLQILQKIFLKPGGEFVVFGDPRQNVYDRPLDERGDVRLGVIPGLWNHELCKSQRYNKNPQLTRLFNQYKQHFFNEDITLVQQESNPDSLFTRIAYSNIGHITDIQTLFDLILKIREKNIVKDRDLTILAHGSALMRDLADKFESTNAAIITTSFCTNNDMECLTKKQYKYNFQHAYDIESLDTFKKYSFSVDCPGIKISTIDSFKGWESPAVILVIQHEGPSEEMYALPPYSLTPELAYTGITRPMESLFIINLGNKKYDDFFRLHIKTDTIS